MNTYLPNLDKGKEFLSTRSSSKQVKNLRLKIAWKKKSTSMNVG